MHKDFKKFKSVDLHIYPINVSFCLLSKTGVRNLESNEGAKCVMPDGKNGNYIFIYLKDDDISLMVHEIFHAVEFTMSRIGQGYKGVGDETWAYLIGYLTKEGLEFLRKK